MAADSIVDVWPDNWQSVLLFIDLGTQWRVGMTGYVGLDYSAVPVVMTLRGIEQSEREQAFSDIRVMESAVLDHLRGNQ